MEFEIYWKKIPLKKIQYIEKNLKKPNIPVLKIFSIRRYIAFLWQVEFWNSNNLCTSSYVSQRLFSFFRSFCHRKRKNLVINPKSMLSAKKTIYWKHSTCWKIFQYIGFFQYIEFIYVTPIDAFIQICITKPYLRFTGYIK